MIKLSSDWARFLVNQPETGMDYQIASVFLKNGRKFDQVVIVGGHITQIKGIKDIPFCAEEIAEIVVTHDKWDFNAEQ